MPPEARVTAIAMTAGYTGHGGPVDLFTGNHRVASVHIRHGDVDLGVHSLDTSSREMQRIPIVAGGGTYRIEIAALVDGSHPAWQETCISELRVMGHAPGQRPGELTPKVVLAPQRRAHDDAMYIAVPRKLVRFDADGQVQVRDHVYAIAEGPGRALYAATEDDVRTLPDLDRHVAPILNSLGSFVTGLALQRDGQLWLVTISNLAHFDGRSWEELRARPFGWDVRDVTVTRDGTVWVSTRGGLYRRRGPGFEAVTIEGVRSATFGQFVQGAQRPTLASDAGLVAYHHGHWALTPMHVPEPLRGGAFRSDGAFATSDGAELVVVLPNGKQQTLDLSSIVPGVHTLGPIEWDAAGRVWASTGTGIVVVDAGLRTVLRAYTPESIPGLDGRKITRILCRGACVTLPGHAFEPAAHHGTHP